MAGGGQVSYNLPDGEIPQIGHTWPRFDEYTREA